MIASTGIFSRSSLSIRFVLAFLVLAVLPALFFAGIVLNLALSVLDADTEQQVIQINENRYHGIHTAITELQNSLANFMSDEAVQALMEEALINNRPEFGSQGMRILMGEPGVPGYDASGFLNNALLMDLTGKPISVAVNPDSGSNIPIDFFQRNSIIFNAVRTFNVETGRLQTLIFINQSNQQNLLLTTAVLNPAQDEILGYLVNSLNVSTLFYPYLDRQSHNNASSYGILFSSDSGVFFTPEASENTIDRRAIMAVDDSQQVIRDSNETTLQRTGRSFQLADKRFMLVTELDTSEVQSALFNTLLQAAFPLILGSIVLVLIAALLMSYSITTPLARLQGAMTDIIAGTFDTPVPDIGRQDEIGSLARSFQTMRDQIIELTQDMDNRLEQRNRDFRVSQDIARTVSQERELGHLLNTVVELLVDNFARIYHAQIFLMDDNQDAVLRASTGDIGQTLLMRGHRLSSGSVSVIGQVVEQAKPIIARDTSASQIHRQNNFLPETRAELAVPLQVGGRVIGALDVQSKESNSFDEELANILEVLAAQVSIAIENVRLYEQTRLQLQTVEEERDSRVREDWKDYMNTRRKTVLDSVGGVPTAYDFERLRQQVRHKQTGVLGEMTDRNTIPLVIPINLRGRSLGTVSIEFPAQNFRYEQVLLAEELIQRLAISLDNARLFHATQLSTERERIVNTISTRLTEQSNIEDILKTAIHELGLALQTPDVGVRLNVAKNTDSQPVAEHNGTPDAFPEIENL